ncbi:MAG TPA: hypothetical protein VGU25_15210 [Acidobacteriaceae bacterium]|nr:hypothetical protein [Acidobacteriaceae bacterium]
MQVTATTIRRALGAIAFSGTLALAAGCHSSQANAGPDPAAANMAPANGQTQVLGQNAAYTPEQQGESYPQQPGYPQQAPAPIEQGYPQQGYAPQAGYPDQELAGEEALEDTTQPPPPLPDYDQPPAPGPDYIWTPGYWSWGQEGYYWVPGAWVEPPYYGALWTPPYWGWYGGRYRFHHGYWGRHVGYYGGIDYGFGYIGIGYFGGYWNNDHFYYNTAVTRVGGGIRNVYQRPVVYNNVRYGVQPANRVSYNGGRGGISVQPRPTEVAAMREAHTAPLAAQNQVRVEASQNRAQFYNQNHGRPAMASAQHGFANTRGIAPAPRVAEPAGPAPGARPGQPNGAYMNDRGVNGARPQPYNEAPRVDNRAVQPQPNGAAPRYDNRAQPQPQPNAGNPRFDNRAQPQPNAAAPRYDNRAQPQPQPRVENRPQPQPQPNTNPRFEHQPSPQPQPRMENRPQPQPQQRPQPQPQPQQRMENRPQPQPQARPQPQPQARMQPQPRPMPQPQQHVENRPAPAPAPRPQAPPPQAHPAPPPQQHGNPAPANRGDEHGHR